jgi:hypothetical protein
MPAPIFRWGFRRALRSGEPVVLYVHPWEIDPDQPRLRANWKVQLRHYRNLGRAEGRLRRLLSHTPFDTLANVIDARKRTGRLPVREVEQCIRGAARIPALLRRAANREDCP